MGQEPTSIFQEWKDNLEQVLKKKSSRIDGSVCPKCKKETIKFDKDRARIYCTSCGFEEYLLQ